MCPLSCAVTPKLPQSRPNGSGRAGACGTERWTITCAPAHQSIALLNSVGHMSGCTQLAVWETCCARNLQHLQIGILLWWEWQLTLLLYGSDAVAKCGCASCGFGFSWCGLIVLVQCFNRGE
jgi:hypothetical protein